MEQEQAVKQKKGRKRLRNVLVAALAVFAAVLIILSNFLVSACLVPDFMRRLDDFERITEESYEQMVQTDSVIENHKMLVFMAEQWLETNAGTEESVRTPDGYTLIAREFRQEEPGHLWALVLHGYTGWKEEMYPFAAWYYRQGYNVLVPDLRCQGESEGDFIGMGLTDSADCLLWLGHILEEDPRAEIVIHGQSMGAATALMMSGRDDLPGNVKAVISDSSYTTAYGMFADKIREWFHLPAFPLVDLSCVMLRLRGGYNLKKAAPIDAVSRSTTPTLFIHGDQDEMISPDMTRRLYEAASCKKELRIISGAGHGQAQDAAPLDYFTAIENFLAQ